MAYAVYAYAAAIAAMPLFATLCQREHYAAIIFFFIDADADIISFSLLRCRFSSLFRRLFFHFHYATFADADFSPIDITDVSIAPFFERCRYAYT